MANYGRDKRIAGEHNCAGECVSERATLRMAASTVASGHYSSRGDLGRARKQRGQVRGGLVRGDRRRDATGGDLRSAIYRLTATAPSQILGNAVPRKKNKSQGDVYVSFARVAGVENKIASSKKEGQNRFVPRRILARLFENVVERDKRPLRDGRYGVVLVASDQPSLSLFFFFFFPALCKTRLMRYPAR